jgi:mannitol/fructose-specific phosphotransferase system IIA component (Ntr-type)
MKLSEYLTAENVILLQGRSKQEVLDELIRPLAEQSGQDAGRLAEAVWAREKLMSTGIGHGLAIPHVRIEGLVRPALAVGVRAGGIDDYPSLDDEPVRIVVMILAPKGQHEVHIRLLAQVADVLRDKATAERIVACEDSEQVCRILIGGQGAEA